MRNRDIVDALMAVIALLADAVTIFAAEALAIWIRFDSGWMRFPFGREPEVWSKYLAAAALMTPVYILVFQYMKLYSRPQFGRFGARMPRIIRAVIASGACVLVINSLLKNIAPYSNGVIFVSMATVTLLILAERALMFHREIEILRKCKPIYQAVIIGGEIAERLRAAFDSEPRYRTTVAEILRAQDATNETLAKLAAEKKINRIILATHELPHKRASELMLFCEHHMIDFGMVPDIYRMLTSRMDFQHIAGVPVLGGTNWPLDRVWNRAAKRIGDIIGALCGLLISALIVPVAAILIKRESAGPIFYAQERCGRTGKIFKMYKLRTMRTDAEAAGAGWTVEDDPRMTRVGKVLRRWNIDELPQFWNVLKGEMSIVGPRPERPVFVEQFAEDVDRYMWRHASKPGMTGWAQVNGLRGDTSIAERVKYDLYYLENWTVTLDLKIMLMTLLARGQ